MICETVTDKMTEGTIIDKTIEEIIIEIGKIMGITLSREIEVGERVERVQKITIVTIQEIEVEIWVETDRHDLRARMLSDDREDRSRPRSNSRVNTNRDHMRCYRCREYDHFVAECPNTPRDEELEHSDVEPASLQMLIHENLPINSNGEVEYLNL